MTIPRSLPSPSTAMIALLEADAEAARPVVSRHHRSDRPRLALRVGHALDGLPRHDAHELARRVHDREPRPAVAQEERVLRLRQRRALGDRDRLGVHHIGYADVLDPPGEVGLYLRRPRGAREEDPDEGEPGAADQVAGADPERDPQAVADDVRNGYITVDEAREQYGAEIDPSTYEVVGLPGR